ncbi:MAG: chromatin binding protein [Watsoniomyces obsoletus]|nr:MAG: chromatin binding protein [Watsoniomyces obsoletus]
MRVIWILLTTTSLGAWALPNDYGGDAIYRPEPKLTKYFQVRRSKLCRDCMTQCHRSQNVRDRTLLDSLDLPDGYDPNTACAPACTQYTQGTLRTEVDNRLKLRQRLTVWSDRPGDALTSVNPITAPGIRRTIEGLGCSGDDYDPSARIPHPQPDRHGAHVKGMNQWRRVHEFQDELEQARLQPKPVDPNQQRREPPPSKADFQLSGVLSQATTQFQQAMAHLDPARWNIEGVKRSMREAWTSFQRSGAAATAVQRSKSIPQRAPAFGH